MLTASHDHNHTDVDMRNEQKKIGQKGVKYTPPTPRLASKKAKQYAANKRVK